MMNPDQLGKQLDQLATRLRTVETHSLGVPASSYLSGAPVVATSTVVVDSSIGARLYDLDGGLFSLKSVDFTLAGPGTILVEGQLDCRSEAWDNYVSAPRREVWTDVGGVIANTHTELPFGLTRITTPNYRSAETAIIAGTYTAHFLAQFTGQNQLHVYGGWLRVTFTG